MQINDIDSLVRNSGDSNLLSLSFIDGMLKISMQYGDNWDQLELSIKTDFFYSSYIGNQPAPCFISISKIEDLSIEKGIYIPSKSFITMMQEVKSGLNLAYGLRESKYKYLFSLIGSFHCHAIIKNFEDITAIFSGAIPSTL